MKEVYCCHMKKSLKLQKLLPTTTNSIRTSIINKVQGQNASLDYRDHSKNKKSKCCWPEPVTKLLKTGLKILYTYNCYSLFD